MRSAPPTPVVTAINGAGGLAFLIDFDVAMDEGKQPPPSDFTIIWRSTPVTVLGGSWESPTQCKLTTSTAYQAGTGSFDYGAATGTFENVNNTYEFPAFNQSV